MTIGERIKQLRLQKNLSLTEVAAKINTPKQNLYKYENNIITNIPINKIEQLAEVLQTTPAYIMGWEDRAKTSSYNLPDITPPSEVDPDMFILDMYKKLDVEDKAEIRGEMKQMLKSSKYNKRKSDINAVFHTNSTDDNSAPLALQITTAKN